MERPEQRLGHAGQHGLQRGEGVPGAPPRCACENLVCALMLLAIQQTGGVSLVDVIFEGLQEQSRLKTHE